MNINIIDREAWIEKLDMASDLSSVHFDERTGHLVLLSDEAKMMLELDAEGELVSFRSLWSGFAGLERSVPQAEGMRSEEHTSELQSLMRISYAVFCLKKKKNKDIRTT